MLRNLLILLVAVTLGAGCASNSRKVKLQNEASLGAESHGMWTRPTEVGYKLGDEISATAKSMKTFGFHVGESKPAGGFSLAVITSGLTGKASSLGPTGQFAAFKAVSAAGVDGIYVTRVETEKYGFPLFLKNEIVTVYGRALTLKNYGPVEQERADRWRYRNYGPREALVITGSDKPVEVDLEIEAN